MHRRVTTNEAPTHATAPNATRGSPLRSASWRPASNHRITLTDRPLMRASTRGRDRRWPVASSGWVAQATMATTPAARKIRSCRPMGAASWARSTSSHQLAAPTDTRPSATARSRAKRRFARPLVEATAAIAAAAAATNMTVAAPSSWTEWAPPPPATMTAASPPSTPAALTASTAAPRLATGWERSERRSSCRGERLIVVCSSRSLQERPSGARERRSSARRRRGTGPAPW